MTRASDLKSLYQKESNTFLRSCDYKSALEKLSQGEGQKGLLGANCFLSKYFLMKKLGDENKAEKELYDKIESADYRDLLISFLEKKNKLSDKYRAITPQLSIIVPVYNSELYLEKCLNSILSQTFKDFELIIVNDGSTDSSVDIISKFSRIDNRILTIENSTPSGNPGTPRNQALDLAKGNYIGFVDSDDWIEPEYFEFLVKNIQESGSDIVFSGGFYNHNNDGSVVKRQYDSIGFSDIKSPSYKFHDSFMIWDKLYRKRFLDLHDIRLGETKAAVDVPFIFKAYYYAGKVSFDNSLFGYNYRRESESSVTLAHRKNSKCEFELQAFQSVKEWSESNGVTEHYLKIIERKMVSSLLYTLKIMNEQYFFSFNSKVKGVFEGIDDADFKEFCIKNKKWWLYKEYETVKYEPAEVSLNFFQKKQAEAREKEYQKLVEPKFCIEGERNDGILFFPTWIKGNPYQKQFYDELSDKFDIPIKGFSEKALCKRLLDEMKGSFKYIHLHWLHVFLNTSSRSGADQLISIIIYAKRLGYKILYTAHNILSHESGNPEVERDQRASVLKHVDLCITHGEFASNRLVNELDVDKNRIYQTYHGSYQDVYQNDYSVDDAREYLGLKDTDYAFVFVGNIRWYKGVDALLTAFKNVHTLKQSSKLIIAGRVMDKESESKIREASKLFPIQYYPGFVKDDELQIYFKAGNCCVLPYKRVLTSGAAMLSLTFGCPVIAPNSGVLPEVIESNFGRLFSSYDEMENLMLEGITSNKEHSRIDSDSHERFLKKFSWKRLLSNFVLP